MMRIVVLLLISILTYSQPLQDIIRNLQGQCLSTEVALADGSCFKCGSAGTRTKVRKSASQCTCTSNSLFWNNVQGNCDCGTGMAMIINGAKISCLMCNQTINAYGKKDSQSCLCIDDKLIWNSTLKRCECPFGDDQGETYLNGECISCDFNTKYASGISLKKSGECQCYFKLQKWDPSEQDCVCSKPTTVEIFDLSILQQQQFNQSSLLCQICDYKLNALAKDRVNRFQCQCPEGLGWVQFFGCFCGEGEVVVPGVRPKCAKCDLDNYALGVSDDGFSCICAVGLKWNPKTGKCICPKSTEVPISDQNGGFICNQCKNSLKFTTLPVIGGTSCTCLNRNLIWSQTSGACTCPDPSIQVFVSSPSAACIDCDAKINADGVDNANFNQCQCLPNLIFQNGFCDCGKTQAYIVDNNGGFVCINCNSTENYMKNRKSPSECNCVSTNLKWDSTTGACLCSGNKVPFGKGSTTKCASCLGKYITANTISEINANECKCNLDQMTFSITNAGVPSCSCPQKNSIITLQNPTCQVCSSGNVLSIFQCKCGAGFYWSYKQTICKSCSTDANAKLTGGSNLHCACKNNYIWDISSQSCIETCTANDNTCFTCSQDSNSDGSDAKITTLMAAATKGNFQGGQLVKILIGGIGTNYVQLSKYQCTCLDGYLWDSLRLKCISALLK